MPKPEHTRIITISNQKGRVGKTTTTVNVSTAMARAGMNVLVIDTDPQGNASTALNINHHQEVSSIYNVLIEDYDLKDVLYENQDTDGLVVAQSTFDLSNAEIERVSLVACKQLLSCAHVQNFEYR